MRSIFEPEARAAIERRLACLTPDRAPRWGRFTAPRMLRHVGEQIRHALGELEARPVAGPMRHPPLNYLLIHVLPWPPGVAKSPPEFLAREPGAWQEDLASLRDLIERFATRGANAEWPESPVFGRLTGRDWGVLVHKHLDHHLTQFGV